MRLIAPVLAVALCTLWPAVALADSLDTFTLSGDGHTFQFSIPSTQTVTEHPHAIDLFFTGIAGTVDAADGYTFGGTVAAELQGYSGPGLLLDVSPLPAGTTASPIYGSSYMLYAPMLTSLIADVANPDPTAPAQSDLLTFMYTPGDYTFTGFDPEHIQGNYTLNIAAAAPISAATPEPAPWMLMLTGFGAFTGLRARRRHVELD